MDGRAFRITFFFSSSIGLEGRGGGFLSGSCFCLDLLSAYGDRLWEVIYQGISRSPFLIVMSERKVLAGQWLTDGG